MTTSITKGIEQSETRLRRVKDDSKTRIEGPRSLHSARCGALIEYGTSKGRRRAT